MVKNQLCSREEVRAEVEKALLKNNELRDSNLLNKLSENNEKIFNHINSVLRHNTTAPSTKKELDCIKEECVKRGTSIALTNQKMEQIEEKVDILIKNDIDRNKKMDLLLEKLDKKYAPMQSWTIMKWFGGIFGGSIILYLFDKWFK